MKKKVLISIVLIMLLCFFNHQLYAKEVSPEINNFINQWNKNVEILEEKWSENSNREFIFAKELLINSSDFQVMNNNSDNYKITFFNQEIEFLIDYKKDENSLFLIIHESGENRDKFVYKNRKALHAGEVLIYTLTNNNDKARKIVSDLRLYDFWGESFKKLGVYNSMIKESEGPYYENYVDEFSVMIEFWNDTDMENLLEIGFLAPTNF